MKDKLLVGFWGFFLILFLGMGLLSYCGKKSCDCGCKQGETCRCADVESHAKPK